MKEMFFKTAGILLVIAFAVISVILGVRAGMMAESIWEGVQTGGGFLFGTALFAFGVARFSRSGYENKLAKVLFAISLLGIAIFGASLATMMVSDTIASLSIAPAIIEWSIKVGAGMFITPPVLVMLYCLAKALIIFIDEHRVFSAITLAVMLAIGVAGYFVWGTLGDAFGAAFGFLFYWVAICVILYAWNGVQENEGRTYWRIGFALALGFLGSGMIFLLSELLINIPALNTPLVWLAQHIGIPSMYGLIGYVLLFAFGYLVVTSWPKLVNWAR